eukprot:m.215217 g.215217  ORF g.215217 m.215217 type:complete len:152 (+) comp15105_c1_seq37:352-807(+)
MAIHPTSVDVPVHVANMNARAARSSHRRNVHRRAAMLRRIGLQQQLAFLRRQQQQQQQAQQQQAQISLQVEQAQQQAQTTLQVEQTPQHASLASQVAASEADLRRLQQNTQRLVAQRTLLEQQLQQALQTLHQHNILPTHTVPQVDVTVQH